jgi:cytochrome c553
MTFVANISLRLRSVGLFLVALSIAATSLADVDAPSPGQQIYELRCASCHGANGEGVAEKQPEPLVGDRSLQDLTEVIVETMPEENPEQVVGDAAKAVAEYVYDAFYSPIAQARNKPPRVELSRLTVRQYQNTIADLLGGFTGTSRWDERRGLNAEYFNSKNFQRDKRAIERVDATVDLDFAEGSPAEKIGNEEFSMKWQGSVIAPDTGEYEFIVRTDNGARLWVNDRETALIDAWVRSGNDTEFRATIKLLGGRSYPLRLEFFKFKEKKASIHLLWKPPQREVEVIAERHLTPSGARDTLIVETPFPPDDKSVGYERGTAVSKAWDEATTFAAIEVANKVVTDLRDFSGVKQDDSDRDAKLRAFCGKLMERAFRRPLSDAERELYIDRQFNDAGDATTAVKRVALLTLKSPRFLFREVEGTNSGYDVAARLSFTMWDSLPDDQLWQAASRGELKTPEQVARQAERMVQDPRAKSKLREFLHQWLKFEEFEDLAKDHELYPDFTPELVADLRTSLDLLLDEVVWSEHADFRQLLLSDGLYANDRVATFYGFNPAGGSSFTRVAVNPAERAGVLSHPYMMTGFAYHATSSPIHRGVFLARNLLGRTLKPPKAAIAPIPADLHPNLTTRERIALQTSPEACALCHEMINPLGFSLEHYDAVGRFRKDESGRPVDASGFYETLAGEKAEFNGVRELAEFLANNSEVHAAFAERLFQYSVKQPVQAYGLSKREELRNLFVQHEFNINKLLIEIAKVAAFAAGTPVE